MRVKYEMTYKARSSSRRCPFMVKDHIVSSEGLRHS